MTGQRALEEKHGLNRIESALARFGWPRRSAWMVAGLLVVALLSDCTGAEEGSSGTTSPRSTNDASANGSMSDVERDAAIPVGHDTADDNEPSATRDDSSPADREPTTDDAPSQVATATLERDDPSPPQDQETPQDQDEAEEPGQDAVSVPDAGQGPVPASDAGEEPEPASDGGRDRVPVSDSGSANAPTDDGAFTLHEDGRVTSCGWQGWAFTSAGPNAPGSTGTVSEINPGDFADTPAGADLCVNGTVSAQPDGTGYALVGIGIQPESGQLQTDEAEGGLFVRVDNPGGAPLRVQIQDTADGADDSNGDPHFWCAPVHGDGGFIPWQRFNSRCWYPSDGTSYAGQGPIVTLALAVMGEGDRDISFDLCVDSLSDCEGELEDFDAPPVTNATVYAFSQMGPAGSDPQLEVLKPDIVIRAFQRWATDGVDREDFDFGYVDWLHRQGITVVGGTTASVLFEEELTPDVFARVVSRDAAGEPVLHYLGEDEEPVYRATLASPEYRQYLIDLMKIQIDGGIDGLFFDEVDGSYSGTDYDRNEGFDDYHLAAFNEFLLNRFPPETDFGMLFGMTGNNMLTHDVPPDDLEGNFNYREYLATNGWQQSPMTSDNPIAAQWGGTEGNWPEPDSDSFVDQVVPHVYWKEIVDALRNYAQEEYGRELSFTSNGVFPYVDFQSVGLYDYNNHGPGGTETNYVPVRDGHLDGSVSLQETLIGLRSRSDAFAPGLPIVLFLDWPGTMMDRYNALPLTERRDFWRLYAAEAYANGLFFAFHLRTTTGEPTAEEAGVLELMEALARFYREHEALYHDVAATSVTVEGPPDGTMLAVTEQQQPRRRIVHLVNHQYDEGILAQTNLSVRIQSSDCPARVRLASPDQASDETLPVDCSDGWLSLVIPSLEAYDVLAIEY